MIARLVYFVRNVRADGPSRALFRVLEYDRHSSPVDHSVCTVVEPNGSGQWLICNKKRNRWGRCPEHGW